MLQPKSTIYLKRDVKTNFSFSSNKKNNWGVILPIASHNTVATINNEAWMKKKNGNRQKKNLRPTEAAEGFWSPLNISKDKINICWTKMN